jgi:ribosomal protein L37AE/L43A
MALTEAARRVQREHKQRLHARGLCTRCRRPADAHRNGHPYWSCRACRLIGAARYAARVSAEAAAS